MIIFRSLIADAEAHGTEGSGLPAERDRAMAYQPCEAANRKMAYDPLDECLPSTLSVG